MKPIKVTERDLVFGGDMKKLLPAMSSIPKEFVDGRTKWNQFVDAWFYGTKKDLKFVPKEGIDPTEAINHIRAILKSWEPKHEHKMSGCAYLLSNFFEDVSIVDKVVEVTTVEKKEE